MNHKRLCWLLQILVLFACQKLNPDELIADELRVFLVAHPDDWQLFMGEFAFDALSRPQGATVIISLTAGDQGRGHLYAEAREQAMLASIHRAISSPLSSKAEESGEFFAAQGKPILYYQIGPAYAYFLRLPDGGITGQGLDAHHSASLFKLIKGEIATIRSIDAAPVEYTKDDLTQAIAAIFARHGGVNLALHLLDSGTIHAPEHSDHFSAFHLGINSLDFTKVKCEYYAHQDYRTADKPKNLRAAQVAKKFALFDAYSKAMQDLQQGNPMGERNHREWLFRSYYNKFPCPKVDE